MVYVTFSRGPFPVSRGAEVVIVVSENLVPNLSLFPLGSDGARNDVRGTWRCFGTDRLFIVTNEKSWAGRCRFDILKLSVAYCLR